MRVILTIDFSPWSAYGGGAQRSTHNLAKALARRGHDVHVIYTKPPWEHVEVSEELPYTLHWATFFDVRSRRRAPLRPLNAWSVARVAGRLIPVGEDVVVHSNGEEGGLIHTLRSRHRFGFVSTPRHPRYPEALLQPGGPSRLDRLRLVLTEGKYLMQGSAARHADLCCPPSAFAADLVQRAYGLDPSRLRVVHNGVPEEFLQYGRSPRSADGPLVFFGRFEATKGVDTLVNALAYLGDEAPHTLIIGRGPDKPMLRRAIHDFNLSDRVELLPWMSHHELARTLERAGLVVLPSREENFSLAVLAAMAVGAPLITTRVGGTPEIVTDSETGLLVEAGDAQALAGAIERLRRSPGFALNVGRRGRNHVREHLTWDVAVSSFESLYFKSLARWLS